MADDLKWVDEDFSNVYSELSDLYDMFNSLLERVEKLERLHDEKLECKSSD